MLNFYMMLHVKLGLVSFHHLNIHLKKYSKFMQPEILVPKYYLNGRSYFLIEQILHLILQYNNFNLYSVF